MKICVWFIILLYCTEERLDYIQAVFGKEHYIERTNVSSISTEEMIF